jgi:hypothetical protein
MRALRIGGIVVILLQLFGESYNTGGERAFIKHKVKQIILKHGARYKNHALSCFATYCFKMI